MIRDPRSNPIRYGPDFVEAELEQSRTNPVGCWVGDFDREPSALKTILIGIFCERVLIIFLTKIMATIFDFDGTKGAVDGQK